MTLITKQKVQQLIYILKQENSRSLFLSCLPGDFKRTRTKLDLARLDDFQPGYSEQLVKTLFKGSSIVYKPTDLDWESTLDESDVTKKLASLHDQGRTQEKEKGSNPLKIGYPILIQENNSATTNCFAAPLFVWDIDLVPGQNKWTIKASKDAPSKNHSLEGLVENDGTAIDLNSLYERFTDGQPLETFTEDFKNAIDDFLAANPKIESNLGTKESAGLDRMQFTKKSDLVTQEARPFRISLVNSALLGKFSEGKVSIIRDLETNQEGLEDLAEGGLKTSILGANQLDPSQASIIPDIINGEHVVLHGPPGTGKSQTITALITAAVAKGMSVAVVCQKLAALEVIENNLHDLGIHSGIAKVTNPIKDRRKLIDEARKRAEEWDVVDHDAQVNEQRYSDLSELINQAKQFAQNSLATPKRTFKDILARLIQVERELKEANQSDLLRMTPTADQLSAWGANLEDTLRDVNWLTEQFNEIKPCLELREMVNESITTAQVGSDLDLIESILNNQTKYIQEQEEIRKNIASSIQPLIDESSKREESIQSILDGSRARLTALPRELQNSNLINEREWGANAFAEEIRIAKANQAQLDEIDNRLFDLKRHPEHDATVKASGIARFFRRIFNAESKEFWSNWRTTQRQIRSLGFHKNDDFHVLKEEFKAFRKSLEESASSYKLLPQIDPETSPSKAIADLQKRQAWLLAALEAPEDHESVPEIAGFQAALKESIAHSGKISLEIEAIQWLSSKGHEWLLGSAGPQILLDFKQHSTRLPLMMRWVHSAAEKQLAPSDFESGLCKEWMEYHISKQLIQNWEGLDHMPIDNINIRKIEEEVETLKSSILNATKKSIFDQFFDGVNEIESHRLVHSFKQEFAKTGKNRKSLRKLYHRHPLDMTRLFPIHLTTPEVVCNLFEGQTQCFDLLIFDEASQVELQDSATCLLKGQSIVVAGDEHQMPPSQYFKVAVDHLFEEDDDEYAGADIEVESLLEFCQQQPKFNSRFLDFHYRSHHPYLIQFSNHAIYSRLVIRPSTAQYVPIQLLDVQGTWENQHNADEIEKVIAILSEFDVPKKSVPKVMIATLNVTQRTKIIRAIEQAKQDSKFRKHIEPLEEAGLNVKNLENLQGDECDVLIISVGYGKTPTGRFSRSYGAINQKHGYRLLNVLITRSRHKVIVLNSIPAEAHSLFEHELAAGSQGTWSRGLLHAYIQYAQAISDGDENRMNRILDILKANSFNGSEKTQSSEEHFDSPFESEVWHVLRSKFNEDEIQLQQPAMGFRIDMVIQPKSQPGLKIAIECDGEAFHSGWQNQLADYHRESLLRGAGYEFVRIWSRNWWMDHQNAAAQLFRQIEELQNSWSSTKAPLPSWVADPVEFESNRSPVRPVQLDPNEDIVPLAAKSQASEASQPNEHRPNSTSEKTAPVDVKPKTAPNHVLSPCLVTVEVIASGVEKKQLRYLFLSNRENDFKGHSRDEWLELSRKSDEMAAFGEESEIYKSFEGKEVDEMVSFRSNQFRIIDLEFDY